MLHLFLLSFKMGTEQNLFCSSAGAELRAYSRASKCQIVIAMGAKPWSERVMFTGEACVCCWIEMFASQLPSASEGEVKDTGILFLHLQSPNRFSGRALKCFTRAWSVLLTSGPLVGHVIRPLVSQSVRQCCEQSASLAQLRRWMRVETGVLSFIFVDLLFIKNKLSTRMQS